VRAIADDINNVAEPITILGKQHHAWVGDRGLPNAFDHHDPATWRGAHLLSPPSSALPPFCRAIPRSVTVRHSRGQSDSAGHSKPLGRRPGPGFGEPSWGAPSSYNASALERPPSGSEYDGIEYAGLPVNYFVFT
jgi:hypothetical protein